MVENSYLLVTAVLSFVAGIVAGGLKWINV